MTRNELYIPEVEFTIHRLPLKVENAMVYFIGLYGIDTTGFGMQKLIRVAKSPIIFQALPAHVQNYLNAIA